MVGAAGIVAWNQGVKEGDTVCIGGPDAAEGADVDNVLVVGVAVARIVEDTSIDTLSEVSGVHDIE